MSTGHPADAGGACGGEGRMQVNSQFLFALLLPTAIGHVPDIAALRAASPRIVVGAGTPPRARCPT